MLCTLQRGIMLNNYRILNELKRTQTGLLLLAQHLQSGQKVVLKSPRFQPESGLSEEEQRARFRRECDIHLYLQHDSIVPALEAFEQDGKPYLVTAYRPYSTLKQILSQNIRFSPLEALSIVQQLCQALHYIHDQGVIHRDVHPENILITEENRVFLMDFGLARKIFAPNITQEKIVQGSFFLQGTLYYMSPEQLLGQADLDFRTDVFSVGVILYQLLTRQLPFEGEELQDVVQNLLASDPHRISEHNAFVPAALEELVFQALQKDPDYRTPTARKLGLEIEALLDNPDLYHCEAHWRLKHNKSVDAAQEYALLALQKNAYHLPSLLMLGELFLKQSQWERAQRCFERILEKDPLQAEAHFHLGNIERHAQDESAACQHFERAWSLAPDNHDYRYQLAVSLHQLGRKYQAMEHLNAIMEHVPDWVQPYLEVARIYYEEDQKEAALAHYRKAQDLDPNHPGVLYALAALQHELGNFKEALDTYRQLLILSPESIEVKHNLANICYLLDELGESRRILEEMLQEHQQPREKNWEISYRLLGFVYARLNLHDDAIEAYKYAILCHPEHLENYLFLASSYREQLQLAFAINTLKYVSDLPMGKEEAIVFFLLARAYYEQGKETESMRSLESCLACHRTLTDSMARQASDDLELLKERQLEREQRLLGVRRLRKRGGRSPYSRDASMNILSFPTSQHRVV